MRARGLSERYVKALSGMELEGMTLAKVHQELDGVATVYSEGPELREIFENPAFSLAERRAAVEAVAKRLGLSSVSRNLLLLLSDKKRTRLLPEIVRGLGQHIDAQSGVSRAHVVSATPLKKKQLQRLSGVLADLRGGPVTVEVEVDEGLIAGVVIEMDGKVYDGSVKKKLYGIREAVLQKGSLEEGR